MPLYYRNVNLFSEIYLEEITQQSEAESMLASLQVLGEYRTYADTSSLAAWKESYVHEVLAALGFSTSSDSENLSRLYPIGVLTKEKPLTVCFSVLPEENLDNTSIGYNWSEKIIRALRENDLQWGVLTNGKQWLIYHCDEPTPYESYLEVNLEEILADNAKDDFQIFHNFMKAENFTMNEEGKCRFDTFKKESKDKIDYIEKELSNALKQREEGGQGVLSDLCMGYVEELRSKHEDNLDDEALRKKIYHSAMLYMFRLLFLLYADARGLLSDDNQQLLHAVEKDSEKRNQEGIGSNGFDIWQQLEMIFVDIDQTYNGGLFSPQESEFTQFLSDTRIENRYLANVIFNLSTYREKDGTVKPISYRDMSVRHLGTLYEGLLEHKLFIAQEDTEVKVSKGKIRFIPVSQGGKRKVGHYLPEGAVYFAGDPSERKSTGSYYTPEYIVDYIVRNTVGEKLKELKEKFKKEQADNIQALTLAVSVDERNAVAQLVEENVLNFVRNDVLQLSVLDPAMGSGHFLVNATNLIANFITELLNELGITGETDSGTSYWRRWVVENCIYGVDLNPLAVELAKLSLWILSMAKDHPLSFLNHHLKCGNSLVGARLEDIGTYPLSKKKKEMQQFSLFDRDPDFKAAVEEVVEKSRLIAGKQSNSLEDVATKKEWLEEIDQRLAGYKAICDAHTGIFFSVHIYEHEYAKMVEENNFRFAYQISKKNKFFHWELEYPEVFLSKGGFKVIVSNPPYDTFKENRYFSESQASGTGNLFGHFIVQAARVNQQLGTIGFVVPLSFACGSKFENCREFIYQSYGKLFSSHYSIRPAKLFPGVDQRITLFTATSKNISKTCDVYSSRLWRWNRGNEVNVVNNPGYGHIGKINQGVIPKTAGELGVSIYKKVLSQSNSLAELIGDTNIAGYFHTVARYWIKAYDFVPYFQRENESEPGRSTKLKELKFKTFFDRDLFILLINSSLFYYWWIVRGDEFDVRANDVLDFRVPLDSFRNEAPFIQKYVSKLMADYRKHSVIRSTKVGGKRIEYEEFYPRKSTKVIYEIDNFVARHFGLTQEQNQMLKDYDLEFRTD